MLTINVCISGSLKPRVMCVRGGGGKLVVVHIYRHTIILRVTLRWALNELSMCVCVCVL